ncbi:hypothetical protein YC2023_005086 [Brassica napus]
MVRLRLSPSASSGMIAFPEYRLSGAGRVWSGFGRRSLFPRLGVSSRILVRCRLGKGSNGLEARA